MLFFTGQMPEHNSIDVQFSINIYSFDHGIFLKYCTYDYVATISYNILLYENYEAIMISLWMFEVIICLFTYSSGLLIDVQFFYNYLFF